MGTQLLKDPDLYPSEAVLEAALGDSYPALAALMETLTGDGYGLACEWRYYNDGKTWLGKVCHKKKTIFWLSVWEGYAQIGFYFTEKHLEGIAGLEIAEEIKEEFCREKPAGKLLPMIFRISRKEQLDDLLKVVEFKKQLK